MGDYSSGDVAALPSTSANLDHVYDATDLSNVGTNDTNYVNQTGSSGYELHQYKDSITATSASVTWIGKSSLAPSSSKVQLQVYKVAAPAGWEDVSGAGASNNVAAADTDFTLSGTITTADYLDTGVTTFRVYQAAASAPVEIWNAETQAGNSSWLGNTRQNTNIRTWVFSSVISADATTINLVFRKGGWGPTLTSVYIGEKAATGDAYDFQSAPTQVLFSGGGTVDLNGSAGETATSDTLAFAIDETKEYIVAFHTADDASYNVPQYVATGGPNSDFSKAGADESSTADVTGYSGGNYVYCLWKINKVT